MRRLVGAPGSEVINDDAISFSSCCGPKEEAVRNSRLGSGHIWTPIANRPDTWIQWDFHQAKIIMVVQTRGHEEFDSWVTQYRLSYSKDGTTWIDHLEELNGNTDGVSTQEAILDEPIEARFVRLCPTDWHSSIVLQVEFLGEDAPTLAVTLSAVLEGPDMLVVECTSMGGDILAVLRFHPQHTCLSELRKQLEELLERSPCLVLPDGSCLPESDPERAIGEVFGL